MRPEQHTSDESTLIDLLARAQAGDEEAAATLVRQYEPEVRRYVRYRLASWQLRRFLDSLDVSQSVFARFFVRLAEGKIDVAHPRQMFKLLFTMAGNRLRDHVRTQRAQKRAHDRTSGDAQELLDVVSDDDGDPGNQVADDELVALFLQRLAAEERRLLDGRMAGKSWQELADNGVSAGAAAGHTPSAEALRKKLSRAIDRVASELKLSPQDTDDNV